MVLQLVEQQLDLNQLFSQTGIQTSTVFAIVLGLEFVIQVREIIDPWLKWMHNYGRGKSDSFSASTYVQGDPEGLGLGYVD